MKKILFLLLLFTGLNLFAAGAVNGYIVNNTQVTCATHVSAANWFDAQVRWHVYNNSDSTFELSVGQLAPGASVSWTDGTHQWGPVGNYGGSGTSYSISLWTRTNPADAYTLKKSYSVPVPANVNTAVTFPTIYLTDVDPPCTTNLTFNYKNNNPEYKGYGLKFLGNDGTTFQDTYGSLTIPTGAMYQTIGPGQSFHYTLNDVPCEIAYRIYCVRYDYDSGTEVAVPVGNNSSGFPPGGTEGTNAPVSVTESTPITGQANTNNIIWSAQSATDTPRAIKESTSVIYDSQVKLGMQAHNDSQELKAGIEAAINKAAVDIYSHSNVFVLNNDQIANAIVGLSNAVMGAGGGSSSGGTSNVFDIPAENTLAGISNLLSSVGDTNADIASEVTLRGMSNILAQAYGYGTNGLATNGVGGVTNGSLSISNYAEETTLRGISNLLGQVQGTNDSYESRKGAMAAMIPSSSTNAQDASDSAYAATSEFHGEAQSFINQLTPLLPGDVIPSSPEMTMSFCGQTIDLDPVHQFPQVANASLIGFRLVLLLAFLLEVGRMFWKLIQIKASTQTGGVPDLEVIGGGSVFGNGGTVGGNALGVAAALAVPVAFLGLFSAVMIYLFSHLGVSIADAMNVNAFTGSLGPVAFYLLASFFPVNLFFSLICTRVILHFTLGKILVLATDAARFLWGK